MWRWAGNTGRAGMGTCARRRSWQLRDPSGARSNERKQRKHAAAGVAAEVRLVQSGLALRCLFSTCSVPTRRVP